MRLKNTAFFGHQTTIDMLNNSRQEKIRSRKKKTDAPEELAQLKRGVSVCSRVTDDHGNSHSALPSTEDPVPRQLTG